MRWLLFILTLLFTMESIAADIGLSNRRTILLTGKIVQGDLNKIIKIIQNNDVIGVVLDSKGGDLEEAIKIAQVVKELNLAVIVEKDATCGSACFFIFIAGNNRLAAGIEMKGTNIDGGFIAIHRPYLANPNSSKESINKQTNIMRKVSTYLDNEMIPRKFIDMMMSRSSVDAYWLTTDDLNELGNYPASIEELYIAKCNYRMETLIQLNTAMKKGDEDAKAKFKEIGNCIADINIETYNEGKRKIIKGWKPSGLL